MLADIKAKHHEEILDQAFRTTEAIRGELDKSVTTLRKTLDAVCAGSDQPAARETANYSIRKPNPMSPLSANSKLPDNTHMAGSQRYEGVGSRLVLLPLKLMAEMS
jgi:hypothetical protein